MDKKQFEEDLLNLLKKHGFAVEGISNINIDLMIGGGISVQVKQI